jgi:hypothetical protein
MGISRLNPSAGGIPYGNTAGRPTPATGKLYSNGETARLELYTDTGWQNIVQETPGVSSITGIYSEQAGSGTITISGSNFISGAIASAIGTNGVEVQAQSTTYNSIVQITAVFTGLSNTYEPYDIKVTNPSNLFGIIPDALYVNASPVWVTSSGSLGTFNEKVSISVSATATDSDSTITYSLASGSSLPSGVTLNSSTGLISGTLPDIVNNTTYTFTINASDGTNTIPRTFSISSIGDISVEYLIVGGGGAGGHDVGGGGGAGGLLSGTRVTDTGYSTTITVGAGGAAITNNSQQNSGQNSSAFGLIAYGGGGGGNWMSTGSTSPLRNGAAGGSGGGGGGWAQIGYGGLGTNGQGYPGGDATSNQNNSTGAGGGGAGGPGANSITNAVSGQVAGGIGVASSITGTSIVYATGGKGGGDTTGDSFTSDGTDGLGNGGDGQGVTAYRKGGSGVVIIAYPNTRSALTIGAGLTYDQPTRAGYRVYRFTAGTGTVTFNG